MTKKCKKCNQEKDLEEFIKDKRLKDGRGNVCKDCQNKYSREYRRGNISYLKKRREHYEEVYKYKIKENGINFFKNNPLKYRCSILRRSMLDRVRNKHYACDFDYFSVSNLMKRIAENPYCECCGKLLDLDYKEDSKANDYSPSLDRVDSNKGYTKDNVAILCWNCNRKKQDSTSDELRIIADFIDRWNKNA